MATPGDHPNPLGIQLTAVDNVVQHPIDETAHKVPQQTIQESRNDHQFKEESNATPMVKKERSMSIPAEAAIPEDPQQNDHYEPHYPITTVAELSKLEALSAMMAYAQPPPMDWYTPFGNTDLSGVDMNSAMMPQSSYGVASSHLREPDEQRISAYAMLEFPDGQFYMNTYSVILGRDLPAAKAAMRRDAEEARRKEEETAAGEPQTPVRPRRDESHYTRSVVSECGGVIGGDENSESDEQGRRRKNRKALKKSKSTGSSSNEMSRRNSLVQPNGKIDYQPQAQAKRYDPESGGVPVDAASLRPSPFDCPLVGIHPPASTPASAYKAISRQHVKIAYNTKKCLFEAEIIGRNGAFIDDQFCFHTEIVPLKSGSHLQIGGVVVRFVLPDIAIGETGAEHAIDYEEDAVPNIYSEKGKQMSLDFEDTDRPGALVEDSSDSASSVDDNEELQVAGEEVDEDGLDDEVEDEDLEVDDQGLEGTEQSGEEEEEGEDEEEGEQDEEEEEEEEDEEEEGEEGTGEVPEPTPMPQKRRGPGRPPKNGIMSKREQQLAKKEAQLKEQEQKAKKSLPQDTTTGKNKVGRPRKHPRPDTPPIKTEKRKYTKRKPKDPDAALKGEGSQDDDKPKEKKEKKALKPPRSPSPTFNEEDLTPEQLAKPQANYVTLIHEALSNSPTGQMSLPQIYRAIQRRYPFFVLKCNTNGWQSSVRHNLSQHHAFKKIERDGKGWMWGIVDGVSIEKEKKRRPTPPHQLPPGHMHQQIYRAGPPMPPHMMPRPPGMMGPPPGYPINGHMPPHFMQPGQPPNYLGPPMNGYPMPGPPPMMNGQHPPGFPPPAPMNQPAGPHGATYSSPYAPKPTANGPPQQGPPNMMPDNNSAFQGPPPPGAGQQPRPNFQQERLQLNAQIAQAIEAFKANLIKNLTGKNPNPEALVTSACNRVLGISSQSTAGGEPLEDKIMEAARGVIAKVTATNLQSHSASAPQPPPQLLPQQAPTQHLPPPPPQQQQQQPPPVTNPPQSPQKPSSEVSTPVPAPTNLAPTATTTTTTKPTPMPSIARPSFSGQSGNRPNGASVSVPRPPMMTPGMARTSSGSPANVPPRTGGATPGGATSASPAPAPAVFAPIATAPVGMDGPPAPAPPAVIKSENYVPQINIPQKLTEVNENGKRPLENDKGEEGLETERECKRLSTNKVQT